MTDTNTVTTLGKQWQSIRATDDHEEKTNVLKSLYQALGKEGTPASEVLSHLGQPDDTSANLGGALPTMPGPMMTQSVGGQDGQSLYLVYYPQKDNKQQYLSFKVNGNTETVEKAEWHQ
ncbi:hypothetical protein BC941DRAFT_452920 [Chlamydoabsidia padenii]|nr:hypothetical protein BC941DRAFT_452920 [Chlamydoabsidia padenii]